MNLLINKNKEEKIISGNKLSRIYTALTGVSFYLFNNDMLDEKSQKQWIKFMKCLSYASLASQIGQKVIATQEKSGDNDQITSKVMKKTKYMV